MILILIALICIELKEQSTNLEADNNTENKSETITPTMKPSRSRPSGRRGGKPAPKIDTQHESGHCHGSLCGPNDIPDEM